METYKIGETLVTEFLKKIGQVVDVSQNPSYWVKDVDLLYTYGGRTYEVEVKWDSYLGRTGNIYAEILTDIARNKDGWFNYSTADLLFYCDSRTQRAYVFELPKLRDYVLSHSILFKQKEALDSYKVSLGYLVPIWRVSNSEAGFHGLYQL